MSAEERLAALLHETQTGCNKVKGQCDADHLAKAARLIAAGVSVPTEPGAPDPDPWLADIVRCGEWSLARWQEAHRNEETLALTFNGADGPFYESIRSVVERLRDYHFEKTKRLASQPVPAPEPSARLREALAPVRVALKGARGLAFDNDETALDAEFARAIAILDDLAATPQDPEA